MLDKKETMWKLLMDYHTLIGSKISDSGIDLYGTEQKLNLAVSLTLAHQMSNLTEAIKEQTKQDAKVSRK